MLQVIQPPELVRKNQTKQRLKRLPEQLRIQLRKQRAEQLGIEVEVQVEVEVEIQEKADVPMQASTQLITHLGELGRMLRGMPRVTELRLRREAAVVRYRMPIVVAGLGHDPKSQSHFGSCPASGHVPASAESA